MPWRKITTADCKFTPGELQRLNNIQGGSAGLGRRLTDVVGEFIGAMNAAQYPTVADGSVPDQLRGHILARTTWLFLNDFPELKVMATDGRKAEAEKAEKMLEAIAKREAGAIESPVAVKPGGNWNTDIKLLMRTQQIPLPSQQAVPSEGQPQYANPAAPQDT